MADQPNLPLVSKAQLADAVERERKRASVRPLDLSFNELADMHAQNELQITPEYQRTFRWSETKQSQFIESIILEMPVPPIYTVEVGEAQWELIDGLQRLSSYLSFRGQLKGPDPDKPEEADDPTKWTLRPPLRLTGCDILHELNGYLFEDLGTALQHRVRRATLRVEVVRRESNPRFAYYMFQRLNSGGEPLSEQETRNCAIRILGTEFNAFLIRLKTDENFRLCIDDLSEEAVRRMQDVELVLRFFAFKNNLAAYVHDIEPFLTEYMERVTDTTSPARILFDYPAEENLFRTTFRVLAKTLGTNACRRYVPARHNYGGGFSTSHFEAFSIGLARVITESPQTFPDPLPQATAQSLTAHLTEAKKQPELKDLTTGGGKNFRRIYERKIELVAEQVRKVL